jgi:hypothetical protein
MMILKKLTAGLMYVIRVINGTASIHWNGKRIFFFRGTVWYVGKMRYDKGEQLLQIFEQKFTPSAAAEFELMECLKDLMKQGILKGAVDIMLQSYWIFAPWNYLVMKLHGYKWDEKIRLMEFEQIAMVTTDFFVCNVSWLGAYFAAGSNSALNLTRIPILKDLLYLKNPLSPSPTET